MCKDKQHMNEQQQKWTTVVIESPYAGDIEKNMRYLRACMSDCIHRHEAPYASHALYTQPGVLNDELPEERKLGIEAGFAFRAQLEKTVVYIDLGYSTGMKYGIKHAEDIQHPIEYRVLGNDWDKATRPCTFSKNKLVEFLYLLMRDAAPTGEIVRIVRMIDTSSKDETKFTSPELQAYAERLAGELLS